MSALRILALASLLSTIAIESSLGGSIHSSANASHKQHLARTASTAETAHTFAAENLAFAPTNPVSAYSNASNPSSTSSGTASGLFLGVTGQSSGVVTNAAFNPVNLAASSSAAVSNATNPISPLASPAPATSVTTTPTVTAPSTGDAFINFGSGPYPEASTLTTGTPQAFFNSPVFTHFFGTGGPSPTAIANFEQEVLTTIKSTYNNAGLAISLTSDPNAPAAHTISVVSGSSYSGNSGAIGITDVGNNGFSFIDKLGGAQTVDQLAIAIGHNISHELMHAFGLANHPEQTGPYVDAASSTLQTLENPSTGFSPAASSLLSTLNFQDVGQSVMAGAQTRIDGDQVLISPSAVPEPSTVVLWVMVGALAVAHRRRLAA